jgi:RNA polymerase sigma-70 factor, ECF subfamily
VTRRGGPAGHRSDPLDALVDAVRRGDRDAIGAVYLEVAPDLRNYLLRRVPHGWTADDLLAQTFLELVTSTGSFRGDGLALRTWLYRAARHNLMDWRKRADRRGEHELTAEHAASIPAAGAGTDDQVLDQEIDRDVLEAFAKLTPEQREVLELRLLAGLPIAAVAELTGRNAGAVKALQHRAVRRLASVLDRRRSGP